VGREHPVQSGLTSSVLIVGCDSGTATKERHSCAHGLEEGVCHCCRGPKTGKNLTDKGMTKYNKGVSHLEIVENRWGKHRAEKGPKERVCARTQDRV